MTEKLFDPPLPEAFKICARAYLHTDSITAWGATVFLTEMLSSPRLDFLEAGLNATYCFAFARLFVAVGRSPAVFCELADARYHIKELRKASRPLNDGKSVNKLQNQPRS